jgi:hypothetical protein
LCEVGAVGAEFGRAALDLRREELHVSRGL